MSGEQQNVTVNSHHTACSYEFWFAAAFSINWCSRSDHGTASGDLKKTMEWSKPFNNNHNVDNKIMRQFPIYQITRRPTFKQVKLIVWTFSETSWLTQWLLLTIVVQHTTIDQLNCHARIRTLRQREQKTQRSIRNISWTKSSSSQVQPTLLEQLKVLPWLGKVGRHQVHKQTRQRHPPMWCLHKKQKMNIFKHGTSTENQRNTRINLLWCSGSLHMSYSTLSSTLLLSKLSSPHMSTFSPMYRSEPPQVTWKHFKHQLQNQRRILLHAYAVEGLGKMLSELAASEEQTTRQDGK